MYTIHYKLLTVGMVDGLPSQCPPEIIVACIHGSIVFSFKVEKESYSMSYIVSTDLEVVRTSLKHL